MSWHGLCRRWTSVSVTAVVVLFAASVDGFSQSLRLVPARPCLASAGHSTTLAPRKSCYTSPKAIISYGEALLVAPVATKAATAAGLGLLGDAIAQASEKKGQPFDYDSRRSAGMTVFALTYTGFFQAWWIDQLGEWVHLDPPLAEAAAKTFLCQFGSIPLLYMPMFFLITGALRGETTEDIAERGKKDYLRIYSRNVGFWIPVQMIQFFYIDPSWQITYLAAMGLLWNTILSIIGLQAPQVVAVDGDPQSSEAEDDGEARQREMAAMSKRK